MCVNDSGPMSETETTTATETDFEPRRLPVQARSRERVDRILDAAAQLLTERGYDAVKTNNIAKRAGVSIGSIYQFFPNRFAIFHALVTRYLDRIADILSAHMGPEAPDRPYDEVLENVIDIMAEIWRSEDAFHAVWLAIRNTAELRQADEYYANMFVNETLYNFLSRVLPDIEEDRRRAMARIVFETSQVLLDHSVRDRKAQDTLIVEELKMILTSYVGTHIKRSEQAKAARSAQ